MEKLQTLKRNVASFTAGALAVSMIPLSLAEDGFSLRGILGSDARTATHASVDAEDGDVTVQNASSKDLSGAIAAESDDASVAAAARSRTNADASIHADADDGDSAVRAGSALKNDAVARVRSDDAAVAAGARSASNADLDLHADDGNVSVEASAEQDAAVDAGASIEPNEKENLLDDLLGGDLPQDALGNNNGDLLDDLLGDLVDLGL